MWALTKRIQGNWCHETGYIGVQKGYDWPVGYLSENGIINEAALIIEGPVKLVSWTISP